ncbi:chromosome-partitioning ATPase Soj [Komagataeibacter europaeus]|jgi:chromosome partitioning protein|uniref:Cobyrinic acid a,c-diamide synthase/plasmid partitioning family protein ParA/MinD n=4 Tax=Acetobacteraceae TaxID=433 RepID=A0A0D6QCB4_KOMXY|nr:chromosome-partitioning ATPase Soj [Komagataeibacter europaeus]GAO01065.1 cobyrinic acid a,c-diamide synthase/plasmid partitioning family protein ParA/MinD [Komagataeibacter xylinus NBRC 13693]GBQ49404.1 ParA-like protein [Komagataeibacter europaeus LMG 18890]GBR38361.1 ParA-like protein [Komagataeibacter oboediens DSM 11826]
MLTRKHDGMKTIAIISQKGGAGKTTLALHLATSASAAGYVSLILDTDPQATASSWKAWRGDADPDVVDCAAHALLSRKLEQASELGAELSIIDTPPHADIMAREACRVADFLLIPCRPRAFDMDAVRTTAELVRASGKPAFVIFTAGPPRAPQVYREAAAVVAQFGIPVAPVVLSERAIFHHSVGSGQTAQEAEPESKAAADVARLWNWVCDQVNMPSHKQDDTKTR